ncbi:peptidase family m3 protein [Cystoisospora suis]|uniref:Peptidase family m3 protein n=1 Tax=Cystoisospora suis TaxID=483139 RepID=A0A2C6KU59_9APIC|nr:peptidase family m3 protein [Cystoisospora suis]
MRRSGVFSVVSLVTFLSLVSSQKPSKRLLFVNAAEEEESANGAKKEVQSASDFARTLPRWDLDRHFPYTSIEDEALDEELAEIERRAKVFMETYKGRLHEKLYEAIREYEEIEEALGQGRCYSYLVESVKKTDTVVVKRRSHLSAKQSRISADYLTFFDLELAELNEKSLQDQLKRHHGLRHYKPYIDLTRKRRPHLLSEEVERALDVRRPWASSLPVVDYFQQRIAESRFKMPGENEEVNLEVLLTKTVSSDPHTRRLALKTVNEGLKTNAITNFAALALNVVAGSWHIEMKERNYRTMRSRRNESNNVPDEVVDALLAAVRTTGVDLTKKYYRLKKSILKKVSGITEFTWADRNAPLGLESDSRTFSFEEAKRIVEEGYRKFSPTMADMFLKFVEEKRIDMPAVHGKRTGAFCHSCTTKLGPFQCLNYTGNRRDVETLAHESGHACHAVLASPQGYLQFHPPLTQAETASTFGEMIVFRDLLAKSPNDEQRLSMLMSKLDSMVNTVVRQCSFDFFEELVHTARGNGTLGDDEFPKLWMHATMISL